MLHRLECCNAVCVYYTVATNDDARGVLLLLARTCVNRSAEAGACLPHESMVADRLRSTLRLQNVKVHIGLSPIGFRKRNTVCVWLHRPRHNLL